MNKHKHTPGPWRWISNSALWNTEDTSVLEASDTGEPYGMASPLIEHHYDADTAAANRALIAAAPDMLSLLMELTDIEGPLPGTAAWAKKVSATIAKATGKEVA